MKLNLGLNMSEKKLDFSQFMVPHFDNPMIKSGLWTKPGGDKSIGFTCPGSLEQVFWLGDSAGVSSLQLPLSKSRHPRSQINTSVTKKMQNHVFNMMYQTSASQLKIMATATPRVRPRRFQKFVQCILLILLGPFPKCLGSRNDSNDSGSTGATEPRDLKWEQKQPVIFKTTMDKLNSMDASNENTCTSNMWNIPKPLLNSETLW